MSEADLASSAMLIKFIQLMGVIVLIWIFYLIIRTAVKNGILRADAVRAQRDGSVRPSPDVSSDDAPVA